MIQGRPSVYLHRTSQLKIECSWYKFGYQSLFLGLYDILNATEHRFDVFVSLFVG